MLHPRHLPRPWRFCLLAASLFLILAGAYAMVPRHQPESSMSHPQDQFLPTSIRFLALGDSYTIGEAVDEKDRWPMLLRDRIQAAGIEVEWYKIIARTGWKTRELKEAIEVSSPTPDYDLVGLLIGVNDYFQGRGLDEYKQRFQGLLDTAVKLARGRKDRVFVISIPDYSYTPSYQDYRESISKGIDGFNGINKKITLAAGIQYFDITPISRQGLDDPELVAYDGLHPSGKQYAAWVKLMEPKILEMLGE